MSRGPGRGSVDYGGRSRSYGGVNFDPCRGPSGFDHGNFNYPSTPGRYGDRNQDYDRSQSSYGGYQGGYCGDVDTIIVNMADSKVLKLHTMAVIVRIVPMQGGMVRLYTTACDVAMRGR